MALTIKQRLLAYHIERRDQVEDAIRKGPDIDFSEERNRLLESRQFHTEAVEYLTGLG